MIPGDVKVETCAYFGQTRTLASQETHLRARHQPWTVRRPRPFGYYSNPFSRRKLDRADVVAANQLFSYNEGLPVPPDEPVDMGRPIPGSSDRELDHNPFPGNFPHDVPDPYYSNGRHHKASWGEFRLGRTSHPNL
jgi:hypothetical protein